MVQVLVKKKIKEVYYGSTKIRPKIPATAITFQLSSTAQVGSTYTALATLTPSDSTDEITWTSSNTSVARVTKTGDLTASVYYVGKGSTTITATTTSGKTYSVVRGIGFIPGSNTLLYVPLKTDYNDYSPNNRTMTLYNSAYGTVAKDSTGFYYFNGGYITSPDYTGATSNATLQVWVKRGSKHTSDSLQWGLSTHYRNGNPYHYMAFNFANGEFALYNGSSRGGDGKYSLSIGERALMTLTYSSSSGIKIYKNGSQVYSYSTSGNIPSYSGPTNIGATFAFTQQYFEGYLSDVIYENKTRTATEISEYYNNTKSNYGK